MRILLSFALVLVVFISQNVAAQTWVKVHGTNYYINKIFLPKDNPSTIVVAADGIPTNLQDATIDFPRFGISQFGMQISKDSGKTFGPNLLNTYSVYSIWQNPTNNQMWYASVRQITDGMISYSSDNGQSWSENELKCVESSQIMEVATKADDTSNVFYMAAVNTNKGAKFAINDFGLCNTIDILDIQARDVKVSPLNSNLVFYAGDNSLHAVNYTTDGGTSWQGEESGLSGLRVLCLMPSSWDPKIVYCGADSVDYVTKESHGKGLYQSVDGGKNWKLIAAKGQRVFQIAQHPLYPKFMAAACDSAGVLVSGTYGYGWEQFRSGFSDTASVRQIAIPAWDSTADGFLAFAGVFGDGLWFTKNRVKTAVEDNAPESSSDIAINLLYPNPVGNILSVDWSNVMSSAFHCSVIDALGRTVLKHDIGFSEPGNHYLQLDLSGLVPGIYTVIISNHLSKGLKRVSVI